MSSAVGGKASGPAVASNDPMAGNNQRQRISSKGCANSASGFGFMNLFCKLGIAERSAERYITTGIQNGPAKRAKPVQQQWDFTRKVHAMALEIGDYLLGKPMEIKFIVISLRGTASFGLVPTGFNHVGQKAFFDDFGLRAGQMRA